VTATKNFYKGTCVYSLASREGAGVHDTTGTPAHIVPSAMGGRKAPTATVCGTCNGLTNARIEKVIIDQFAFVNCFLAIKPDRSDAPRLRVEATDGTAYILAPGGFLESSQRAQWGVVTDDSTPHYQLIGKDERQMRGVMDGLKNKLGDLQIAGVKREYADEPVTIARGMVFGEELGRFAVKVAFEYLALQTGDRNLILDSSFDAARAYILDGVTGGACAVAFDDHCPPPSVQLGPVDHAISVVTNAETRLAYAFVTLYGRLSFVVLLTGSWMGPTTLCEYVVNPLTGKDDEPESRPMIALSGDQIYARLEVDQTTTTKKQAMMQEALMHILEVSHERRPGLYPTYAAQKAAEVVVATAPVSADERRLFYLSFAEMFVRQAVELGLFPQDE